MIRRLNKGRFVVSVDKHQTQTATYPHSGLYKFLPFVILDRCRRSNPLVNEVYQRLCLDPLPEELRAIIENVEIYEQINE